VKQSIGEKVGLLQKERKNHGKKTNRKRMEEQRGAGEEVRGSKRMKMRMRMKMKKEKRRERRA